MEGTKEGSVSKLRPECGTGGPKDYCPDKGTALLMTLNAVRTQSGLIHGRLRDNGGRCAVGSYFLVNPKCCYPGDLTDEVAAVNDSMPNGTPRQRKQMVMRWLRWKLTQIGMPGFTQASP
jgi:hypothetical protein